MESYYRDSEGKTWKITAKYGPETGLPADVELKVRELGKKEKKTYLAGTAEALGKDEKQVKITKAFDITFEKEGIAYHKLSGDVEIKIELLDGSADSAMEVVHFAADGNGEDGKSAQGAQNVQGEVVDSVKDGNTVSFSSDEFSVYVVAQEELTRSYIFYNRAIDVNGNTIYDNGEVVYSIFSQQVLIDGESVVEPPYPYRDGVVFKHWSLTKNGEEVDFADYQNISIDADTITGTTQAEKQAWLDAHPVEFYAVYENPITIVTFYNQSGLVVEKKTIEKPETGANTLDTRTVNYLPIQDKEGAVISFEYWTDDARGTGAEVGTAEGTPGVVNITANSPDYIDLYPRLEDGHYLYFDSNRSYYGLSSADYIPPATVINGNYNDYTASANAALALLNSRSNHAIPTSTGYTFKGWYIRVNDKNDYSSTNTSGMKPVFYPENGTMKVNAAEYKKLLNPFHNLPNNPTLYAHWEPVSSANYNIAFLTIVEGKENGGTGGGVYQNNGVITLSGGEVKNNYAEARGGGVCIGNQQGNTGEISGTVISQCYAPQGGGLYYNVDGGTLTISSGSIESCAAVPVTITNGTASTGTGMSANRGGGIFVSRGTVELSNGTVKNNTGYNGGVYIYLGTLNVSGGSIQQNTNSTNGGGVFVSQGTLSVSGGSIEQNTASNNGGGVYVSQGTVNVSGGNIENNTAKVGAGVFVANGTSTNPASLNMSGGSITGNTATGTGGGVDFGGTAARLNLSGNATITNNLGGTEQKNVVLNHDSNEIIQTTSEGLGADARIGVYVTGVVSPESGFFVYHGGSGDDFGTYAGSQNLELFVNDRTGATGEVDTVNASLIRWSSFICQFTNGTTLLYYRTAGTESSPTAWAEAKFKSLKDAYSAMDKLYTKNADNTYTKYDAKNTAAEGKDTRLEMLVDNYELQQGDDFTWGTNNNTYYKLTWTTAPSVGSECTVTRGNVGTNYNLEHCDLTLENITLDNSGKGSADGGIFDLKNTDSKLTLNDGATLKNAVASGHGGAVDIENGEFVMNEGSMITDCQAKQRAGAVYMHDGTFTMNGGTITNCSTYRDAEGAVDIEGGDAAFIMKGGEISNCSTYNEGGAIYIHPGHTFTMEGGTITGCSASKGAAIYADGIAAKHAVINLKGGTITGNTVTDTCSAIQIDDRYCNVNISGSPVVYDNVTSSGDQRNIDITNDYANNIITVTGTLNASAKIGVYAPTGHDAIGEQFGNYISSVSADNFDIFKNDKNIYLIGKDGGDGKLVWGPVICKIVDTDDKDEHVFGTLNAAVGYARDYGNGAEMSSSNPVKIEMLVDYEIPSDDKVTLDKPNDNIIITTAQTSGGVYNFKPTFGTMEGRTTQYEADGKTYKSGDSVETAILSRKSGFTDDSLFAVNTSAKLTTTRIILDGADVATTVNGGIINSAGSTTVNTDTVLRNSKAANGGALYASGGYLNIGAVSILDCYATQDGGAIYNAVGGTIDMTGGYIEYCMASENGGGIYTASIATQTAGGKTVGAVNLHTEDQKPGVIKDCSAANGGGIYLAAGELDMAGGTIEGCTAERKSGDSIDVQGKANSGDSIDVQGKANSGNGGGIYIEEKCQLKLSGSPNFGGTADTGGNRIVNGNSTKREDIYIEGHLGKKGGSGTDKDDLKLGDSVLVTDKLYEELTSEAAKGQIWVGAEEQDGEDDNHWDTLKQFAKFADDLMTGKGDNKKIDSDKLSDDDVQRIYAAFRNAKLNDYYGMSGEGLTGGIQYIYWEGVQGSRKVILRKVNENYGALSGAKFEITKGSKKIEGTDVNGNEDVDAFVSGDSGVFYIGMMDYGVYVLKETKTPDGYSTANPYYYLVVDDDGALMSDPSKTGQAFSTADAAKAAGDAKYKERENARKGSGQ